jgi:Flp pilus assembly protein TadD
MHRIAVRIAILALGASALGGCGMMGLGGDDASTGDKAKATHADDATTPSTMTFDVATNVRKAQLMRSTGDTLGATKILSQLMLVYPDDPRVVGEYGKLLVQENRSAEAIEFLQRAVQLQPSDWMLYSAMGVAYDKQNDSNNARLAYERALQLKPGEPAVLNNYGMSRMMAGDMTGARSLLMQAKANGATDPKIDTNLAMLDRLTAPAVVPAPDAIASVAPRRPATVARAELPAPAHVAPAALGHGNGQVVMQDVPVDPLAGPVAHRTVKPAKVAKAVKHNAAPVHVAAVATKPADKPAKKTAKPAADHIPALRMTADASKP